MPELRRASMLSLLALLLLGVIGNFAHLPLFFGVDFIFGSVATLIAARLLGFWPAIFVALIASLYTFFLWGHPYALIIFLMEAAWVSLLVQRSSVKSLFLADGLYWLFFGMPLVWLFYYGVMGMEETQSTLILLKQPANGIANAIIANLIIMALSRIRSSRQWQKSIELRELFFTTISGLIFVVVLLLLVYQNDISKQNYEARLIEDLDSYAAFRLPDIQAGKELSSDYYMAKNNWAIMAVTSGNKVMTGSLASQDASKIYSSGEIRSINERLSIWLPDRDTQAFMTWWKSAYYLIEYPLQEDGVRLVLLQSSKVIIDRLQQEILKAFMLLFGMTLFSSFTAYYISGRLTKGLLELADVTQDLPLKIKQGKSIVWPRSQIAEFSQLSSQVNSMAQEVRDAYTDVSKQAVIIVESSLDAIITINEKRLVESFNTAAEKYFGYSRNEVIGRNVRMLMPESVAVEHDNYVNNYLAGERTPLTATRRQVQALRKDGTEFPVELFVTEIELHDRKIFSGIITDISERKENEKMKQAFISSVSHELRTPLTSINGAIKLVRKKAGTQSEEKRDHLLEVAERNIERLAGLVNDLLDFEALDAKGVVYNTRKLELLNFIPRVVEDNEPYAQQYNVTLKIVDVFDGFILADESRLSQVLTNFISNACKFSRSNAVVEIGVDRQGSKACLYVRDSGAGISSAFRPRVFGRFQQGGDVSDRKVQRGTGLGLAISKRMTEDMSGEIGFDSVEGEGSIFYVLFKLI